MRVTDVSYEDLLWSRGGEQARVTITAPYTSGITLRRTDVPGDSTVTVATLAHWVPAMSCDYCDRPASLVACTGDLPDLLCHQCAARRPDGWVKPLDAAAIVHAVKHAYPL